MNITTGRRNIEGMERKSAKRRAEMLGDVKGLPVFGYTVYWSIPKLAINQESLENILKATIGEHYMPRKPIAKRVLSRALKELKHLADAGLITKVRDDSKCVAYVVTEEVVNKEGEIDASAIDYELRTIVIFDKVFETLKFNNKLNTHAVELQRLFDQFEDVFTTEDIRKVILEYIRDQRGVTLRESGGIYFVPCETAALDTFLNEVGGTLYALPMLDCGSAKKQMYEIVKYEIETQFETLAEEIKHLASKGKTSELVFKRRLEEFKELRQKTEAYRDLLKVDADVLETKITEIEDEVRESIVGIVKDYEIETHVPYNARVIWKTQNGDDEPGIVVGYSKHKKGFVYVKIKLDSTGRIQHVSPNSLTMVEDGSVGRNS